MILNFQIMITNFLHLKILVKFFSTACAVPRNRARSDRAVSDRASRPRKRPRCAVAVDRAARSPIFDRAAGYGHVYLLKY